MVFIFKRKIQFAEVDAAGILYYPRFFAICHQTFESCFDQYGPFDYSCLMQEHRLGFPTIKVEADYFLPLSHGDVAVVQLEVIKIVNSSLVTQYTIERQRDKQKSFKSLVTTVCMDLNLKKSKKIPENIRNFLNKVNEINNV